MDDLDIWRSAAALIKAYGDFTSAALAASQRAKEFAIAALVALCGCTAVHEGPVKTSADAISLAQQTCGDLSAKLSGRWHARWETIRWFLWHDPNYSLQVEIDTQTGEVMNPGCFVNPRNGVYIRD